MNKIILRAGDGASAPFVVTNQVTVVARGLEPGDEVTLWLVLMTEPMKDPCSCPPGQVVLPDVLDEVQLECCGEPIVLTRERSWAIIDSPQQTPIRAKLALVGAPSTQSVYLNDTNTANVNDRMRGCPCAPTGA